MQRETQKQGKKKKCKNRNPVRFKKNKEREGGKKSSGEQRQWSQSSNDELWGKCGALSTHITEMAKMVNNETLLDQKFVHQICLLGFDHYSASFHPK